MLAYVCTEYVRLLDVTIRDSTNMPGDVEHFNTFGVQICSHSFNDKTNKENSESESESEKESESENEIENESEEEEEDG